MFAGGVPGVARLRDQPSARLPGYGARGGRVANFFCCRKQVFGNRCTGWTNGVEPGASRLSMLLNGLDKPTSVFREMVLL